MKPRDYCCCAVPVMNAGVYAVLTEQLALGIIAGTLAIATPHLVGAATPSFAPWIFAVICYVGAALQVLGLIAVKQEKQILYRRYITLHIMLTLGAFSIAAVWIIISASRHSTAQSRCLTDFFTNTTSSTAASSEGNTLCDIFPWVDVGLMGGLWVVLAISQFYFYIVVSAYGSAQREAATKYNSMYDAKPLTTDIPMADRSDPWDARMSPDHFADETGRGYGGGYGHNRNQSVASVSTTMGDRMEQPRDGYAQDAYAAYPSQPGPTRRQPSSRSGPSQPAYAYTQDPGPTPQFNNFSGANTAGMGMGMPERAQAHPAEGSFRRKTPRVMRPSEDFDYSFFAGR